MINGRRCHYAPMRMEWSFDPDGAPLAEEELEFTLSHEPANVLQTGDWNAPDPRCSGDPHDQGFVPVCFMQRENVVTGSRSGFAEKIA